MGVLRVVRYRATMAREGVLERGLVVRAGTAAGSRGRAPRVVVAAPGRGLCATAPAAAVPATAAAAADLVHLGRGVAQRGADLVHFQLDDGALLALARLERPLPQPP